MLGLVVHGEDFALAVMEPGARRVQSRETPSGNGRRLVVLWGIACGARAEARSQGTGRVGGRRRGGEGGWGQRFPLGQKQWRR